MPTSFTNLHRCGGFERMAENVSNTQTRRNAYHAAYETSENERAHIPCSWHFYAAAPTHISCPPRLYKVTHQRGRLKSKGESVSSDQTRRNAYCVQMAPKRPLPLLPAPSNRSLDPTGGLWTTNIHCNGVRHVRKVEMRGYTYRIARILMWLVQDLFMPVKRLRWLAGRSWMTKVHYNKIRDTRKGKTRGRTYRIARILMRLLQPFSMPSKRLQHPMGGLWIMRINCNEVRSTSKSETRGHTHRTAGIYMQLPQALSNPSKRLRNIANTYWRKGGATWIDAERGETAKKSSYSQTAASQQQYEAR
ncbi:hypothetical protein F5141DRAFT_1067709 [Pisolithus sp. B1]|nr:hypothetical protein F5141DRAFT_1067709 [Pisolithus sp. B1]